MRRPVPRGRGLKIYRERRFGKPDHPLTGKPRRLTPSRRRCERVLQPFEVEPMPLVLPSELFSPERGDAV